MCQTLSFFGSFFSRFGLNFPTFNINGYFCNPFGSWQKNTFSSKSRHDMFRKLVFAHFSYWGTLQKKLPKKPQWLFPTSLAQCAQKPFRPPLNCFCQLFSSCKIMFICGNFDNGNHDSTFLSGLHHCSSLWGPKPFKSYLKTQKCSFFKTSCLRGHTQQSQLLRGCVFSRVSCCEGAVLLLSCCWVRAFLE